MTIETTTIIIAILAFVFSIYQFIKGYRINSGVFLLQFRECFCEDKKYKLHVKLRNGDKLESDDWPIIDDYMGLFEVMNIMIRNGALDRNNVIQLYEYRLLNIVKSSEIFYHKLICEYKSWKNFYLLLKLFFGRHWIKLYKILESIEKSGIDLHEIKSGQELKIKIGDELFSEIEKIHKNRLKQKYCEIGHCT
jgi:hypothetical protein